MSVSSATHSSNAAPKPVTAHPPQQAVTPVQQNGDNHAKQAASTSAPTATTAPSSTVSISAAARAAAQEAAETPAQTAAE
ncbi:MAG: hypothetical protein JO002_06940, partial [Burkholderiaceae bacterium]|nr:hypothetical protein [Burkholderiaceae bacterium]